MKLSQRIISVLLSDEGREVLQLAVPNLASSGLALFEVEETDELGIWVRMNRKDGPHTMLVRWDFVVVIDVPVPEQKNIGLKA